MEFINKTVNTLKYVYPPSKIYNADYDYVYNVSVGRRWLGLRSWHVARPPDDQVLSTGYGGTGDLFPLCQVGQWVATDSAKYRTVYGCTFWLKSGQGMLFWFYHTWPDHTPTRKYTHFAELRHFRTVWWFCYGKTPHNWPTMKWKCIKPHNIPKTDWNQEILGL